MSRRPARPDAPLDPEARRTLLQVYREADTTLAPYGCPASADCCHFARTGKEPSVTYPEWLEVVRAVKAMGKKLPPAPQDNERTCPFLVESRCSIYASRPLGCRTYFCHRVTGPGALPRPRLAALVPRVQTLAEAVRPSDPAPRTLSSWLRQGGARPGRS